MENKKMTYPWQSHKFAISKNIKVVRIRQYDPRLRSFEKCTDLPVKIDWKGLMGKSNEPNKDGEAHLK
jgi:hypothetical protein